MASQPISLDPLAYLERIQFAAGTSVAALEPSARLLRELHLAHLLAVPFENLSIHYGQPITLDQETLFDKIVRRRRGGFCYELNGLFSWLLRALGFRVSLLSAEVARSTGGFSPAFDHLTLLVRDGEGARWVADVGFGDSFRFPLRLQPDVEQDAGDGYRYRLWFAASGVPRARPAYWIVQRRADGQGGETDWQAQYRFTLRPRVMADFDERCRYQQTSPESHFTKKRVCSLALPENGRLTLSDLRLIITQGDARVERDLGSEDEYRSVLAERFGIVV